jgi:hypothetical protein
MREKKALKRKQNLLRLLKRAIAENTHEPSPVCVEWRDASGIACGWTSSNEIHERGQEEPLILTCGWLIEQHKTYILVALSMDPTAETYDMVLKIPRENIRKMKRLAWPK